MEKLFNGIINMGYDTVIFTYDTGVYSIVLSKNSFPTHGLFILPQGKGTSFVEAFNNLIENQEKLQRIE